MTTLPNRRAVEARLHHEWKRWKRQGTPVTVVAVDLDHFKRVNDTLGHLAGDELLFQVGQRLQGEVRTVDTVARTGGEEFLVLLPDTEAAPASLVAERLRAVLAARPFELGGTPAAMTASLGLAQSAAADNDAAALLARADAALYRAKTEGRNRCCQSDLAS